MDQQRFVGKSCNADMFRMFAALDSQFPADEVKRRKKVGRLREGHERIGSRGSLGESAEINSDRDEARQHAANCTRILNNGY